MSIEERTHTALHVVKGAIQKTLGAKWSASATSRDNHGRITVQFDRKPTEEEIDKIQDLANQKIAENATVEIHQMSRDQAENRWGDLIYDLFPLPKHVTELQICHINDWNVNACNKKHTTTTGEIGKISLRKTRFRNKKKLLEVSFVVE